MTGNDHKEPLLVRTAEKLLVGSGPQAPFLVRHDWAIPAIVFGGCGLFMVLALIASFQGWGPVLMWIVIGIGALCVVLTVPTFVQMFRATRGPLPALDRTPRTARVVLHADDAEGGQTILVEYRDAAGEGHDAQLADVIHESWEKRFSPGSRWQVYAFRDPELTDTVVFLTEVHDDVWRDGWKLDGVRIGGEGGPVKPGPGSPFLRTGSKWEFAS
ncbi:hypothetical protein LTT02_00100 [Mycolicibacterium smegmatis]|uniref:hypothetical protein n=1 Tax=Mycolicibacterium smegmatis TaxID=1772 RepID=UPI0005D9DD8F|nr:hypothetical protein [Mycolicibacterium smegmatis]MCP2624024.1 hypothetical protein [Mycolicibacterium smegmatis]MDF1899493.1 hypothetical protein [Mycolicibacterium smegmatis]MDF1905200.1 hypothetical protein [Mycolicibacterium smegmatis]MDF1918812.1 hypothetical protein [Mycolicibacterium smegmatis]MDF1924218.1 hypothetical protein [Mycolicibacterium smegmatis]